MSATAPSEAAAAPPSATIVQGGRAKAYRPLPPAEREAALLAGVAAYRRGDYFLAHEHLEPAWMGAADPAERSLYQGLIKLAAAYVHRARGNPRGMAKNLAGARAWLGDAARGGGATGGLDVGALLDAIDERRARLATDGDAAAIDPPTLAPRHER